MHTVALLEKNPRPTDEEIHGAFRNVQCRCGTHIAIMRAVKSAAKTMSAAADGHTHVAQTESADADQA
jgi:aerobic-type carbon monoxide dehydrogenase small subunit (CoxS/CutS family)